MEIGIDNEVITRQIKALKTKKAAYAKAKAAEKQEKTRQLDEAQMKEVMTIIKTPFKQYFTSLWYLHYSLWNYKNNSPL